MAVEGEGIELIIALIVVLVVVIVEIIAWKILKKRRSLYTYKYSKKSS